MELSNLILDNNSFGTNLLSGLNPPNLYYPGDSISQIHLETRELIFEKLQHFGQYCMPQDYLTIPHLNCIKLLRHWYTVLHALTSHQATKNQIHKSAL